MSLSKLHEGLSELMGQAWKMYFAIMQSEPVIKEGIQVVDDALNDSHSYSFLDEGPLCERQQKMFCQLIEKYDLAGIAHIACSTRTSPR